MKSLNKKIVVLIVFMGLFLGYSVSTVIARLRTDPVPLTYEVSGDFASPVTVSVEGSFDEIKATTDTLITGQGKTIAEGDQVFLNVSRFIASGNGLAQVADLPGIVNTTATEDSLNDLVDDVVGATEGTRLLVVEPGSGNATIDIVDIVPTRLYGEVQTIGAARGVPTISVNDDGTPRVDKAGGAVADLQVMVQLQGEGSQVTPEDSVYANYMLVDPRGKIMESSYNSKQPVPRITVADVFPGLQVALVDQRVGSRVIAAVPSGQAQGETDVVVIVDILGVDESAQPAAVSGN